MQFRNAYFSDVSSMCTQPCTPSARVSRLCACSRSEHFEKQRVDRFPLSRHVRKMNSGEAAKSIALRFQAAQLISPIGQILRDRYNAPRAANKQMSLDLIALSDLASSASCRHALHVLRRGVSQRLAQNISTSRHSRASSSGRETGTLCLPKHTR